MTTPVVTTEIPWASSPSVDATANLGADPNDLRDIIIATGSPFSGQARGGDVVSNGNDLRGYTAYTGGVAPFITGGTLSESHQVFVDGAAIYLGRYSGASSSLFGAGSGSSPDPGEHPLDRRDLGLSQPYLSDVLYRHRDLRAWPRPRRPRTRTTPSARWAAPRST